MKKMMLLTTAATLILGSAYLMADDDEHEYRERGYGSTFSANTPMPKSAERTLYDKECGSCHMAYQSEFLPRRSWQLMMTTLEDHFKTDATLEEEDFKTISAYLYANAADSKPVGKPYRKIANSIPNAETPLRISETPYFVKEHREVPQRYIEQKEVKSIANCTACHTNAVQGDYRERSIFIPNYGPWDD